MNQTSTLGHAAQLSVSPAAWARAKQRRLQLAVRRKAVRRRIFRYGLVGFNVLLLVSVTIFVVASPRAGQAVNSQAPATTGLAVNPLDQLSAASVAVNVAQVSHLAEATAVKNQADTANAELAIVPAGDSIVSKPQVISAALKSRKDIQAYTTSAGDTISSLAVKFGVTSDSIKYSNGLLTDAIKTDTKLTIPPVNGIIYTVKAGDTAQSLAQKYNANADQITLFNDAEVAGLQTGQQIEIPNGQQPAQAQTRGSSFSLFGGTPTYGSNGYDFGYCTYWVAARRAQVGEPVPTNLGNASSWSYLGRTYGLSVGTTPQAHAAVVTSTAGAGHVAFVESVNSDGSIDISEMNHNGWDVTDTRTIPASEAGNYSYIY